MEKIRQKMRKAKGFTLVELLIVIIIIGILAGALLLAAGAGTDKAKATNIVSNMRNLKAASLMYYADYNAWPTGWGSGGSSTSLDTYLDKKVASVAGETYQIRLVGSSSVDVFVQSIDTNVWKKIKAGASTFGISADTSQQASMPIKY